MNERQYWVGFNLVKGIGPVKLQRLIAAFGSLSRAWGASLESLERAGLDTRTATNLMAIRSQVDLGAEITRLDRLGIAVLTWDDEEYPAMLSALRAIDQAPPVLYTRGTLVQTDEWAVTIVGTRAVSAYGRQVVHQLAGELAANGLTVVSGLARGIDREAHQAALDAGGRTVAVLPCGLDMIYPPEHRQIAARIIRQGALISIFPLGTQPLRSNFPARNRVMSGLARGTIVVEAGLKSGALMTAGLALEQGREVFAVPGNITALGSSGTNRLIQDGAHPVLSAKDVLDVLNLERIVDYQAARRQLPAMNDQESAVWKVLSAEPAHIDEITLRCGLPVAAVSSALATLELKGMARQAGPMTYAQN